MGLLRLIGAIIILIGIAVIVGIVVMYSGIYNVAASYPDSHFTAWVLDTTMTKSVQHHAEGIKVPPLTDPKMLKTGFSHYQGMCVSCHGAPGVPIGEVGRGLRPDPPELTEAAGDWKPNELFWLTKNGVRMTGMPSWGVTHTDAQIWAIVAFLQTMPKLTPEQYRNLVKTVPPPHAEPL